jgi:hypothetical protein
MFEDEARFGRLNDPRRCWAPAGIRPRVGAQVVREYTHVFAAVSPADGTLDTLILPEADTGAMSLFLAEVSRRHPTEEILMILDGAGWHRAKALQVPANLRLLLLPPHSPELNPAEHVWEEIREKWFTNLVFADMNQVEQLLERALRALEDDPERMHSLTGFDWIIRGLANAS